MRTTSLQRTKGVQVCPGFHTGILDGGGGGGGGMGQKIFLATLSTSMSKIQIKVVSVFFMYM